MSGRSIAFGALVAAALLALLPGCGEVADGGRLKWQKEPKQAFELARFTGKPMLLYFTSDG